MLKNKTVELLIKHININLYGMYELNYDGICLNLKKNTLEYCLYVSSNEHYVFERLLAIDSFITGMAELNERVELKERGE